MTSCDDSGVNEYYLGSIVRVTAEFRNKDTDELVDPPAVGVSYEDPEGDVQNVTNILPDSVGKYHHDIDTTLGLQGRWWYKWFSTGAGAVVKQGKFDVVRSEVG